MNRISRRSPAEEAEALLEAGRTEPVLHYDVESGLERHHQWLRSDAPLPEWAGASLGAGANSWVPVAIKTLVSAVLIGAIGFAAWHATGRPQPSAAAVEPSSPVTERARDIEANAQNVVDSDSWLARTPIPVPEQGLPHGQPMRRSVPDKRTPRSLRAHKEPAAARAARAPAAESPVPVAETSSATPARVEPAAAATTREVATAPEPKPISATNKPRPEPAPQAQTPDDLIEMQQVAAAEQLLQRSPERALALVRQGDQRFAGGYFQQERAYIATMALIRLGRIKEARARAASFDKRFPALPYGVRLHSALDAHEAAAP